MTSSSFYLVKFSDKSVDVFPHSWMALEAENNGNENNGSIKVGSHVKVPYPAEKNSSNTIRKLVAKGKPPFPIWPAVKGKVKYITDDLQKCLRRANEYCKGQPLESTDYEGGRRKCKNRTPPHYSPSIGPSVSKRGKSQPITHPLPLLPLTGNSNAQPQTETTLHDSHAPIASAYESELVSDIQQPIPSQIHGMASSTCPTVQPPMTSAYESELVSDIQQPIPSQMHGMASSTRPLQLPMTEMASGNQQQLHSSQWHGIVSTSGPTMHLPSHSPMTSAPGSKLASSIQQQHYSNQLHGMPSTSPSAHHYQFDRPTTSASGSKLASSIQQQHYSNQLHGMPPTSPSAHHYQFDRPTTPLPATNANAFSLEGARLTQQRLQASVDMPLHSPAGTALMLSMLIQQNAVILARLKRLETSQRPQSGALLCDPSFQWQQLQTLSEYTVFEDKLSGDQSFREKVIHRLAQQGGKDADDSITRCMNELMAVSLQRHFTRGGTAIKRSFNVCESLIKEAVLKVHPGVNLKQIEVRITRLLKDANAKFKKTTQRARDAVSADYSSSDSD